MPGPQDQPSGAIHRFGTAELDLAVPELRINGKHAALGPRGVGLLGKLIEQRGRAVSKRELLDTVWRGVIVEENNLQVQVSTLRRLLGPQAIATIPGRGYRFMPQLEGDDRSAAGGASRESAPAPESAKPLSSQGNLPERLSELYGREVDCAAVQAMVERHPLVSIVGAAGIGKTRLALASASALAPMFPDGVWIADLAVLNDPRLLIETIAQAMRLVLPGQRRPTEELAAALRDRRTLLLMDNCEHLIGAVAPLVGQLLRDAGTLHILVTSQELLRLTDEQLYRLAPLSVPENDDTSQVTGYGAVRLFVERVRALQPRFELSRTNVGAVVEICRRLDGLPLAIELAAARVPMLGVTGVKERIGERFRVLTGGSRFAPKRHQTLRAALDWSHALLNEEERAVYRRLSVFVGSFSLENAQALAAFKSIDAWPFLDHLSSLVEKSLVMVEGESRPRYRMLESTREHALEQLAAAGETDECIARHADVTWRALERTIKQRQNDAVRLELGNIRSAYEWARGDRGNAAAAVALATLPAMMMAVEGHVREAQQRLVEVEPLIDDSLPRTLVAQYWQWYGRIGRNGRLPSSLCIEALQRAEQMFIELENPRHVHGCRRHIAEAMLDAGNVQGAAAALERARELEQSGACSITDRTRRLRVEGLWLAKAGRVDEALATSSLALDMARHKSIDRYELVLLDDIARIHLEAGNAKDAAKRYRVLADRSRWVSNGALIHPNALVGLIASLTADADLDAANAVLRDGLLILHRSGILLARADILACLMARRGRFELAARLLGISDHFHAEYETTRGVVEQRCRDQTLALLGDVMDSEARVVLMSASIAGTDEAVFEAVLSEQER